jgi:hypothetical protein
LIKNRFFIRLSPQDLEEHGKDGNHQEGNSGIPEIEGQEKDDGSNNCRRDQHPNQSYDQQDDSNPDNNQGYESKEGDNVHKNHLDMGSFFIGKMLCSEREYSDVLTYESFLSAFIFACSGDAVE